jgi:hypothetical protein
MPWFQVERIRGLNFFSLLVEEKRSAALDKEVGMSSDEVARDFFRKDLLLDMVVFVCAKNMEID